MKNALTLPKLGDGGVSPTPPPPLKATSVAPLQSEEKRVTVLLNVYSLLEGNKKLGKIGMGVFHSGVVLYGIEWGYGECLAHPEATGLFLTRPGTACGTLFRTINLGVTTISPEDVDVILHQLEREWRGGDYHILDHNCNHFAQTFCDCLSTVEQLELPPWCNRAARVTNRVVPRRLATKLKNMMDPPDAKEKYIESSTQLQSVIPANWFTHPSVFRPPRNVPAREHDARRVTHTRASRSFTSISSALDDMGSMRTDDGFDFGMDDNESCCSRVLPLASVELQPQLLDQLRLRRRSSSISMSTDRMSLHSIELKTRQGSGVSRGRGRGGGGAGRAARGGGRGSAARGATGGDRPADESITTAHESGARYRGPRFAAPTEASTRRERLSSTQLVERRESSTVRRTTKRPGAAAAAMDASTSPSKGPAKSTSGDHRATSATAQKPSAKAPTTSDKPTASGKKEDDPLMAGEVALLGERLSGTAGPLLESPVLSDISEPNDDDEDDDDAVRVGSTSPPAPVLLLTKPPHGTQSAYPEEINPPTTASPDAKTNSPRDATSPLKRNNPTDATVKESHSVDEDIEDNEDDDDDDFPFLRHIDPSMLAAPVGILMVRKSRRRAKSIQERKEMLLRVMGGKGDEGEATAKKDSELPPVESIPTSTAPVFVPSPPVTPPASKATRPVKSAATAQSKDDGKDSPTASDKAAEGETKTEAEAETDGTHAAPLSPPPPSDDCAQRSPTPKIPSTPAKTTRLTPLPEERAYPRRHTVSNRLDSDGPLLLLQPDTTRNSVASSLPTKRRVSGSPKVFHLSPMPTSDIPTGATGKSSENSPTTNSQDNTNTPAKEQFQIDAMTTKGFIAFAHSPSTGPLSPPYPHRASLASLTSKDKLDHGLPSPTNVNNNNTVAKGPDHSQPSSINVSRTPTPEANTSKSGLDPAEVIRKRSPTCVIGVEAPTTPLPRVRKAPTPLLLVEKSIA